jgi:hypothetical protein
MNDFDLSRPAGNNVASDARRSISRFLGLQKITEEHVMQGWTCAVMVVTSGGMTVPLEANTVRSLDTRRIPSSSELQEKETIGCAAAEYYLSQGFRVIYLHRKGSKYFPFTSSCRKMFNSGCGGKRTNSSLSCNPSSSLSVMNYRDSLQIKMSSFGYNGNQNGYELIGIESDIHRGLQPKNSPLESLFLPLSFETIHHYFALLEFLFQIARLFGPRMSFCLTANVPKYYISLNKVRTVVLVISFVFIFLSAGDVISLVNLVFRSRLIKCNQTKDLIYLWKGLLVQSRYI